MTGPLSAILDDLIEKIASDMQAGRSVQIGPIYSRLLSARDEAVLLEARAGRRDLTVHKLLRRVAASTSRHPEGPRP